VSIVTFTDLRRARARANIRPDFAIFDLPDHRLALLSAVKGEDTMADPSDDYTTHVNTMEAGLADYAKKSFEADEASACFVDGGEIQRFYSDLWRKPGGTLKLRNRTPLQLERDRILYSAGMRKQTEKYHVLFSGQRRIVRNYTTHTMRMAQVTRAICSGLRLNAEFAEAIALGAKLGAVPFIHAGKVAVAEWVRAKILELDNKKSNLNPRARAPQLKLEFGDDRLPPWVANIASEDLLTQVAKYIPWAAGSRTELAYTAGQESYWLLCTNPFTRESHPATFSPDTMFGIWRHTRGLRPERQSFHHRCAIPGATAGQHEIKWTNSTYEALVVQYADDITWVIENLNDANTAGLLQGKPNLYDALRDMLGDSITTDLLRPLSNKDSGGLYTYFITDFVDHSQEVLKKFSHPAQARAELKNGNPDSFIGLSQEAESQLDAIARFLHDRVFSEPRLENRKIMLDTITRASLDLFYKSTDDTLPRLIEDHAKLERWQEPEIRRAKDLIADPVHRIQLSVDVLAYMGDQDIYEFVGIHPF
jgi:dGTP triphosphohydrolase